MKRKRTYQTIGVQQLRLAEVLPLVVTGCIVALDVAKQKFVVALASVDGTLVKLFRFEHPTETRMLLDVVAALRDELGADKLRVAMEPTGSYGDAIRHQLVSSGARVMMVSPNKTHDSQAIFDNVQSLHDPKSALLVAKLCAMGLATDWTPPAPTRERLRALVELRQHVRQHEERCMGRLEGLLARHWPEFGQWMEVRQQKTPLRLLATYSGPSRVEAGSHEATTLLFDTSRGRLSRQAIEGVVEGARTTLGVPMMEEQERYLRTLALDAEAARNHTALLDDEMKEVGKDDEAFARLATWMGTYTAAVLVTMCDPLQYENPRQLEKACGLNLREKSSGEHRGRLSITKRGPGLVRQVLYLFALRMILESPPVRAWYRRRRAYTDDAKRCAIVAVMRKLARAAFHVAKGATFDASKLFDLRRLDLESCATRTRPNRAPRTTPRPIARGAKRSRKEVNASA